MIVYLLVPKQTVDSREGAIVLTLGLANKFWAQAIPKMRSFLFVSQPS